MPKRQDQLDFSPQIEVQKGEVRQKQEAPKNATPFIFENGQTKNQETAQPQSEPEPQNEARFVDCAILGDRPLFRNADGSFDDLEEPGCSFWLRTALIRDN